MEIYLFCDNGACKDLKLKTAERVAEEIQSVFSTSSVRPRFIGDPFWFYKFHETQLNTDAVLGEFGRVAPQEGALRLVVTGYNLAPGGGRNFAYGAAWQGVVSVVSTYSLREDPTKIAIVAVHQLLHQIGLVGESQSQHDNRRGRSGHCRNSCVMRPLRHLKDLWELAADWEQGVRLCDDCARLVSE